MVYRPILYRSSYTATADIPFKLVPEDRWFESFDIFFYDNSAYMGDLRDQDVLINSGEIFYLTHPVNLADFFFKNSTAGNNTRIVVAGVLLSDARKKELGIPVV